MTTVQLAEAMQRSAGAANTYGVELEKNIGYTTAIAEVTRESGSVVGGKFVAVQIRKLFGLLFGYIGERLGEDNTEGSLFCNT